MPTVEELEGYVITELLDDLEHLYPDEVGYDEFFNDPPPLIDWIDRVEADARPIIEHLHEIFVTAQFPFLSMLNIAQYGFDFEENGLLTDEDHENYLALTCDDYGDMYLLELDTGLVVSYGCDEDILRNDETFDNLDVFLWIMIRLNSVLEGVLDLDDVEGDIEELDQPAGFNELERVKEAIAV